MADPIEIIQTVISVTQKIYGVVKNIQGAPGEMKAIDRAILRVLPILEHLLATLGQRVQTEDRDRDARALQSLCDECRELVDVANGFLGNSDDGTYQLRKKEWPRWLMKKSDRKDLAKRFHDLHGAISSYLSYDVHRELTVELRVIRNLHQTSNVAAIQRDVGQSEDIYSERDGRLGYEIAQRVMRSAAQSQMQDLDQHHDEVTTADTGTLVRTSVLRPDPAMHPDSLQPCTTYQGNPCNDLCPPSCRCRCHHPPITPIPRFLRSVVGSISIDHDIVSGLRSIFTPCNDQGCRRHRSNLLKIKYYCPTWFAQINAEIRTERIPVHFTVQTPRVVQGLGWIQIATLDEVRQKLWGRELTVNDVRPHGESVLHLVTVRLAVDRSDAALSIVALLTEHSAPTDWECEGLTPTEDTLWWSLVYWRRYESRIAAINALRYRLGPHLSQDIDDAYDELATKLRWIELHRRICHLTSLGLTTVPPELASQVNIQDSWGWTPLFYAALVNPEAIHALLAAGANPRINTTILGWAARAGADTVISVLVRAGALTNASDSDDCTALHEVAFTNLVYSINGFAVALELVRHAEHLLDWDARDDDGYTALDWAQRRVHCNPGDEDSKRILKLYQIRRLPDGTQYIPTSPIVDVGDDDSRDDSTGLPPTSLIRAGIRGDVSAIGDLICRGTMVNERDDGGRTLLHLVALGKVPDGYRVALELVRHGGWGVDWDALVAKGERETIETENKEYGAGTCERNSSMGAENEREPRGTALEIVRARLDKNELTEQEREELEKVCDLLETRRLPLRENYLWPCMDPDFWIIKPSPDPIPRMPGAWDDEWN